jgi:hypothetical protein
MARHLGARIAEACFGVASLSCIVAAASEIVREETSGPRLEYQPAHRLGNLSPHEAMPVRVTLSNETDRPVQLLGAAAGCGLSICVEADGLPMAIPPGSDRDLQIDLHASGRPGPFSDEMVIYTDCPGQLEVHLTFHGSVVEPKNPVVSR